MTGKAVVKLCERQAKNIDNNVCSLSWANLSYSALMPSGPDAFPHLSFSICIKMFLLVTKIFG